MLQQQQRSRSMIQPQRVLQQSWGSNALQWLMRRMRRRLCASCMQSWSNSKTQRKQPQK
jgi:hypothetical protein